MLFSRLGEIMGDLHSQSHIRASTESLFETQRHRRADSAPTLHHIVKLLPRDPHGFCGFGHAYI